jgi:hypothetical protein
MQTPSFRDQVNEFGLETPLMQFRRKKTPGEAIDYMVQLYQSQRQ